MPKMLMEAASQQIHQLLNEFSLSKQHCWYSFEIFNMKRMAHWLYNLEKRFGSKEIRASWHELCMMRMTTFLGPLMYKATWILQFLILSISTVGSIILCGESLQVSHQLICTHCTLFALFLSHHQNIFYFISL
jgi:hypothetical protein